MAIVTCKKIWRWWQTARRQLTRQRVLLKRSNNQGRIQVLLLGGLGSRRRRRRGGEVWGVVGFGEWCPSPDPSPITEGSGEGLCPLPRNSLISCPGKLNFGTFWHLIRRCTSRIAIQLKPAKLRLKEDRCQTVQLRHSIVRMRIR